MNLYLFTMGSNINLNRKVNVDVTNRSVDKILQQMFDGTDVEYFINDRQIIVRKKQVAEKTVPMIQQEKKITVMGNVKDENGEPLIGVNVVVRGTMIGCVTDIDGNFSLADVSENAVISISYIGYQTQDIPVKATINVVLKEDSEALNEVVVIGYGNTEKSGSVWSGGNRFNQSVGKSSGSDCRTGFARVGR